MKFLENIFCSICHGILRKPVQTQPCGHRFCSSCLSNKLPQKKQYECPECHGYVQQIWPDAAKDREIKALKMECTNIGCLWIGNFGEVEKHKGRCEYESVVCAHEMCEQTLQRKDVEAHMKEECSYRLVTCEWCTAMYQHFNKERHEEDCLELPLVCECGQFRVARKDMVKHVKDECERTIHPCDYQQIGCRIQGTRSDLARHLEDERNHHMHLMLTVAVHCGHRVDGALDEMEVLKSGGKTLNEMTSTLVATQEQQKNYVDDLKEKLLEKHDMLQKSVDEQNKKLHSKMYEQESRLEEQKHQVIQQSKVICAKLSEHNSHLKNQCYNIHELKENAVLLPQEMDRLFSEITVLEPTCNTLPYGSLLFVVDNFQENFRKEKEENILIYSDPFYCLRGYKALICLFLNGWENGKNTHISCYFEVLKGPFDQVLKWPLKIMVNFTIRGRNGNDFRLGFDTGEIAEEELEKHFGKPSDDANPAWGFSCFMEHKEVDNYVLDNVMNIYIDTSPLKSNDENTQTRQTLI